MPAPGGVPAPGGCLVENPPGRPLLRAVRILLECILVLQNTAMNFKCLLKPKLQIVSFTNENEGTWK